MPYYRSFDFERIYNEFLTCYPSREEAESQYLEWIRIMRLDESKPYGQARESYLWTKDDLQFVREDSFNKYYEVEVGFPTTSMNGNVYRKRDLVAAALTLKGKHPSLNHKNEFWFSPNNPRNRWGNIEIIDGKFHEGVCKALVKVPKDAICPVCDGKPMTELIDSKHIVNVSLEGDCVAGRCDDGTCEGFFFTDPPFTFLTVDVLPGIPMTRIKPLESYMPLRSSNLVRGKIVEMEKFGEGKEKVLKIKPKIIEEIVDTSSIKKPEDDSFRGTWGTPIQSDAGLHSVTTGGGGNVAVLMGVDNEKQMSSGYGVAMTAPATPRSTEAKLMEPFADYADMDDCIAKNSDKEDPAAYCASIKQQAESKRREQDEPEFTDAQGPYAPMDGPSNDTSMPKPEDDGGPKKTKPPADSDITLPDSGVGIINRSVDPAIPSTLPTITKPDTMIGEQPPKADDKVVTGVTPAVEQAEDCGDGLHWDAEQGKCVPDSDMEEMVKRIKAETHMVIAQGETVKLREDMKKIEVLWSAKFGRLLEDYRKQNAYIQNQETVAKELRESLRKEQMRCEDLRVEMREVKNQFADATSVSNKYSHMVEDLKIENAEVSKKYQGALQNNLELSKKVTIANEEYLNLARQKEILEDQLGRAKINAKKTLKLRV